MPLDQHQMLAYSNSSEYRSQLAYFPAPSPKKKVYFEQTSDILPKKLLLYFDMIAHQAVKEKKLFLIFQDETFQS